MSKQFYIKDFTGGKNARSSVQIQDNEAYEMQGFLHTEGGLLSNYGRQAYNLSAISGTHPIKSHHRFYNTGIPINNTESTTQVAWTVIKCHSAVWVDTAKVNSSGAPVTTTACDFRPILARTSGYKEHFCPFGGYLYMSDPLAGETPNNKRWDGTFYCVGTVSCAGGTAVTGQSSTWTGKGAIRKGDTIFFKPSGTWNLTAYRIATASSNTKLVLRAAGPNTSGSCAYMAARTHNMGIVAPTQTPTVATAAGGSMTAGNYYYKFTHKNSQTTFESNPSPVSPIIRVVPTGSKRTVTVGGWATSPGDFQVDQLRIYRTNVNHTATGSFYFATAINRTGIAYTFAANKDDTVADASLSTTTVTSDHDPPPGTFGPMHNFNSRIWTRRTGAGQRNKLYISNLDAPEYFSDYQFGTDEPTSTLATLGGVMLIGNKGDWITGIVGEGGAYETTGKSGANLLVLTKTNAYRIYGWDWSDWAIVPVFGEGCVSEDVLANASGLMIWVSRNGIAAIPSGGRQVIPVYQKLWPTVTNPFLDQLKAATTSLDYALDITGAVWRDWYLMSMNRSADAVSYNSAAYAWHMRTNSFMTLDLASYQVQANDFSWWNGQGDKGELYYSDANAGILWQLFVKNGSNTYWPTSASPSGTVGAKCVWHSKTYDLGNPYMGKRINRIVLCFQRPSASGQTIQVDLYTNGDTATPAWSNTSVSIVQQTDSGEMSYAVIGPEGGRECRSFALKLTGTFTIPIALEYILVDYDETGWNWNSTKGD